MNTTDIWAKEFAESFAKVFDEFNWLYCEVYYHDKQQFH